MSMRGWSGRALRRHTADFQARLLNTRALTLEGGLAVWISGYCKAAKVPGRALVSSRPGDRWETSSGTVAQLTQAICPFSHYASGSALTFFSGQIGQDPATGNLVSGGVESARLETGR
jgi:enamine deaminase RidA (YjgF/YER057c/UK114 family)